MQLTIPDCCLGEFCPGVHVDGHRMKDDVSSHRCGVGPGLKVAAARQGTYYLTDDYRSNAYHYHNTCVFPLQT